MSNTQPNQKNNSQYDLPMKVVLSGSSEKHQYGGSPAKVPVSALMSFKPSQKVGLTLLQQSMLSAQPAQEVCFAGSFKDFCCSPSEDSTDCSSNAPNLDFNDASDVEQEMQYQKARTTETTVLINNLAPTCTRQSLMNLMNDIGFQDSYDMIYLPFDFKSMHCRQFAFVNFLSADTALIFQSRFASLLEGHCIGEHGCRVSWAVGMQGLDAAISQYRNSPMMHVDVPAEWKPLLLQRGQAVPFPEPTKTIKRPKEFKQGASFAFDHRD
jgi:hypothetical protein